MTDLWAHHAIVRVGDENDDVLRRRAHEVSPKKGREIAKRLLALVTADPGAAGLAAPQIGVPLRVVAVRCSFGIHALINPVVQTVAGDADDLETDWEQCYSLPGVRVRVARPTAVYLKALNTKGKLIGASYQGRNARVVLHELDHLDGILITDHAEAE